MIFRRPNHQIAHLHAAYRVSAIKHVPSSWSSQRINIKNIHIFVFIPHKLPVLTYTTAIKWQFYRTLVALVQ